MDLQWIADKLFGLSDSVSALAATGEKQNLRLDQIEDEINRLDREGSKKMRELRESDRDSQETLARAQRSEMRSWFGRLIGWIVTILCGAIGAAASVIASHLNSSHR